MTDSPTDRWPRIALLDPTVANQIAAGEVVERPASVVKELVENSLDAGATRVHVLLEDGGRKRIQIVDNGHGMDGPSAHLAFARHATSKLHTADELMDIRSFGFRGEALASILAVSRVTLTTRRPDVDVGVRLSGGGGVSMREEPAGCPVGTDLVIADLFYNVPARLKFLRTPATELGQVLRFIDALALARPDLHLTVTHNGKRLADYPPDPDLPRRANAVLGRETAGRLYPIESREGYDVTGLLSDPGLDHAGPSQLVLLVNGRHISDRTLQHAIAAAYGTLLERGRYPVGVVSLQCPPDTVDVNVHPAKAEVRFVSSQAVHAAISRAVRGMLAATPWIKAPNPDSPRPTPSAAWTAGEGVTDVETGEVLPSPRSTWGASSRPSWPPPKSSSLFRGESGWRAPGSGGGSSSETATWMTPPDTVTEPLETAAPLGTFASLRYVGQVGRCFLVCETADALVLVDQHAAHERVLFERFVQSFRQGGFPSQQLLIPETVPLAPAEVAALIEADDVWRPLGFDLEASGERMVRVRAQPSVARALDLGAEVKSLAASLLDGGRGQATVERLERVAATLACHAAVRSGDSMTAREVAELLGQMDGVDLATHCPHGRPVVLRARLDEVARWFHRT